MKLNKTQIQALADKIRKTIIEKNKIVLSESEKRNIKKEVDMFIKFKEKQDLEYDKKLSEIAKNLNISRDNIRYNIKNYKTIINLVENNVPKINTSDIEKDIILATIDNPASVEALIQNIVSKYVKK